MRSDVLFCERLIEFEDLRLFVCDDVNERGVLEEGLAEEEVALDDFETEGVGLDCKRFGT